MKALEPSLVRRYSGDYPAHEHAHAQVLIGLQGLLQLEVDGRATFVDAACGVVVPAGSRHAYLAARPAQVLVLDCPAGRSVSRLRRFGTDLLWTSRLAQLSQGDILDQLAQRPTVQARRGLDVGALAGRIDAELARAWCVAGLAALCHMSPSRFRARFAELTGVSPLHFVRQRRLAEAARLLSRGWTLEAAALHVGYAGATALSFALRRDMNAGARDMRLSRPDGRSSPDQASLES